MHIIWFIAAAVFTLFAILLIVRVIQRKRQLGDVADAVAQQVFNFKEFLKMAYPAALIYSLLYVVFIVLCRFQVFGEVETEMNALTWIPSLTALYVAIWLLIHIIDMDCRSRNAPFAAFLKAINTNTGVHIWNYVLLVISIIVLVASLITLGASGRWYIGGPLFLVVFVSVLINLFAASDADWKVKAPSQVRWSPSTDNESEKVRIKAAKQEGSDGNQGKTPVERVFYWDLKEKWGIQAEPEDAARVTLYKEDWEAPQQELRQKNPFWGKDSDGNMNWVKAQQQLAQSAATVLQGVDGIGNRSEKDALQAIVDNALALAGKYNLAEYEVPDLLLSFTRYAITYKLDEECNPISSFNVTDDNGTPHLEYFRFAAETLFDMEGDCDCKSVLACRLLKTLGVDAKLIGIAKQGETSPSHAAIIFKDEYNRYKKCKKYPEYTYCDATCEGWSIGDIPEGLDENTITILA